MLTPDVLLATLTGLRLVVAEADLLPCEGIKLA